MIAWILGIALVISLVVPFLYRERAETYRACFRETLKTNDALTAINADLKEELKRTGTHRDELQARYRDQEADREIKAANSALRSERARKASQARWGKKVA